MKHTIKTGLASTALLALVAAMSAPAFADILPNPVTSVQANVQISKGASVHDGDGNRATIKDSAFQWATGNIGANVASGDGNQQANSMYIDQGHTGFSLFSGAVQLQKNNRVEDSSDQRATITDSAFYGAKGNMGVNVAAGNLNQQSNAAVILNQDQLNGLVAGALQGAQGAHYCNSDDNHASISDSAFEYASGNVGVNVAGGNGNQQANSLVINNSGSH
ncbi:MAG: hypothetical protein ACYDEU_08115 [Vulcanimicrobiaceae bacterium]